MDEMSIKKQNDFDGKSFWGYVNLGIDLQDDEVEPAQEALVLMVVCVNSSWKLPIGYFLIKSLTGAEKANIINEAVTRLFEVGIDVVSVTCDGPTAHFSMFKELGCNFADVSNLKPYFQHPCVANKRIYAIFDACHMLKLLRNSLAVEGVFLNSCNEEVDWKFIENLHQIQEEKTLLIANKLGKRHMDWEKHKMKVSIAAQTLSISVAEALVFLCEDIKHPQFQRCLPTVNFIKTINKLFDVLNSRIPWAKGWKAPLTIKRETEQRSFLLDTKEYLRNLKNKNGLLMWKTPKKTAFLGFIVTITSVLVIFDDFIKNEKLKYLLTYKLN